MTYFLKTSSTTRLFSLNKTKLYVHLNSFMILKKYLFGGNFVFMLHVTAYKQLGKTYNISEKIKVPSLYLKQATYVFETQCHGFLNHVFYRLNTEHN